MVTDKIEPCIKRKMTLKRVKTSVVVIWIACYLLAGVPMMIFLKNELYDIGYYFSFPVFPMMIIETRMRSILWC